MRRNAASLESISHFDMSAEAGDVGSAAVGGGAAGRGRFDTERDLERRRRLRSAHTAIRHAAAAQRSAQIAATIADNMPMKRERDQRNKALVLLY